MAGRKSDDRAAIMIAARITSGFLVKSRKDAEWRQGSYIRERSCSR
jgi:hypothetical protein